jgi:digeranylgeranylglycerophospholipid reductase
VKDAVEDIAWLSGVPAPLVKRIDGVRLYAPDMRHIDLFAPGYYFWATDTPRLLDWMVQDVRAAGVDVRLDTVFTDAKREGAEWIVPCGDVELRARYLVGADGPHSRVAKALGLSSNTQFLFGVEHEYASANASVAPGLLHCFVDRRLAPGYIGWAFAGVTAAQVGLARRLPHGASVAAMEPFLRKIAPVAAFGAEAPAAVRAGMIPCGGLLERVARPGAMLVGDAAGMVSPVTAGGIHTALRHGERVGEAVAGFLQRRMADPAEWLVESYPRFRTKRMLRWCFDRFQSDWAFNLLLATRPMRRAAELVYFHRKGGVRL